ncbi:lipoprotein, putative [Moritella sp. PE36]|uniref:hypothetical protein n=1 Tax=Moritella sp. PE36 TaxID=58051 RepID=UPI0001568CA0|nr:hypothetical protein [Moritella sp. PE36]EDM65373.1 lipoprotein, putative [Moritella sp. PE36]
MKLFFKYISLAVFTAVLFGCESEGNSTPEPITPPTPPPIIDAQLSAMDFHTSVQFSQPNQPLTFNISNYVAYSKANHIRLKNIEVLSDSQTCQISNINAEQQSFTISPNKAGSCDYRYTVSSKGEEKSAWASITFSAVQGVQTARNDHQQIPKDNLLPDINKATSVGETITFSVYDELSSELLAMNNPVFETSTMVAGSGLAFITEEGDFNYYAVDIGLTKVSYSVVDNNGLAFTGLINIDVSGDINTAPIANDATYDRTQGVGSELTLDIMNFPGFGPLVEDAEGDRIQLVSIQAFNAEVKLADANAVTNTSFTFRGDSKAIYTVNYTVYDHEVDGISSGTITIETDYIREGILEFSFHGFIKLFGDGELGAAGRTLLMRPFTNDLIPYMHDNSLYATGLKNIGFGNFKIDVSSENGGKNKIILFAADNGLQEIKNIITLPATSQVYYGLTYSDRILGYGGLVFEVTAAGDLNVHNQITGTANLTYKKFTDKMNALSLTDIKKVDSFGPYSAVVFFNDGTATYYTINTPDGSMYSKDWTKHIGKVAQCWDAPTGARQMGSFYCLNKDQSSYSFWKNESSLDNDKDTNFFLKFIKDMNDKDIKIVKATQVLRGIAALTDQGDLYVSFNGKDADGNTYSKGKRVARRVMSYQQASNYVTYMYMVEDDRADKNNSGSNEARDHYYLEFNGYAQHHQEKLPDSEGGKTLNMTLDFGDIGHSNRKKVKFYENTANAVALLIDNELKILTHKGLKAYGGRDHHNNIIGDSGNSTGTYTATLGQGRSTFFARGNKTAHQDHWELYSPLEELHSSLTCENKPKHGEVSYPYILTGCLYLDFKMNGAVIASPGSDISVYPEVRFANEDASGNVYPDLVDLDKDGLSTESEINKCLVNRTEYHAGDVEYCSQPILSDSDGDDVLDSFEFLHQDKGAGKGNYQSRYSNIVGDYHDNTIAPFDGNKDIDNNGQLDKYDN